MPRASFSPPPCRWIGVYSLEAVYLRGLSQTLKALLLETSMARLETLPYELLSEITSLLPYSALASLCLTSRALHIKVNPLLWRHLQFGPALPHAFGDRFEFRVSSAPQPQPPYLRIPPDSETGGVRCMGGRDILKFYTAARKGWIRDEAFELVRSIELRDGVLGGCLEPFDNVGWWMNGEFHAVFEGIVERGLLDGLASVGVVYDRCMYGILVLLLLVGTGVMIEKHDSTNFAKCGNLAKKHYADTTT